MGTGNLNAISTGSIISNMKC